MKWITGYYCDKCGEPETYKKGESFWIGSDGKDYHDKCLPKKHKKNRRKQTMNKKSMVEFLEELKREYNFKSRGTYKKNMDSFNVFLVKKIMNFCDYCHLKKKNTMG
jgi:hypothetical protein